MTSEKPTTDPRKLSGAASMSISSTTPQAKSSGSNIVLRTASWCLRWATSGLSGATSTRSKILSRLSRRHSNVKLVFDGYGSAEQIRALTSLANKLGVKDKLLIRHSTSDSELAAVYAGCDVFIYPSKLTWSLAVTEAMAASKPVVVPEECGVSEILQNGVNGIVISDGGPAEVANKIESLMDDPKVGKKLGENAYAYVRDNLSWAKYAQRMENVFEQTISNAKKS